MALNLTSDEQKLDVLRKYYTKYGDASAADRVLAKGTGQADRVYADIEENLQRSISKAKQYLGMIANAEVAKGKGENVKTSDFKNEYADDVKDWLKSVKSQIDEYGDYLDDSVKQEYSELAGLGTKYLGVDSGIEPLEGFEGVSDPSGLVAERSGQTGQQGATGGQSYDPYDPNRLTTDTSTEKGTFYDSRTGRTFTANVGSGWLQNNPYVTRVEDTGETGTDGATDGTSTETTTTATETDPAQAALDEALAVIQDSNLPDALKSLYSNVVQNWDPNIELNPENIINAFNDIKNSTIDPYYQGLANLAIASVKESRSFLEGERTRAVEVEDRNADESIRTAKAGLEAAGLTFSGEARRQLGAESAYQQGTETGTNRIPFGGEAIEGLIPQENRLISTSSQARYEQQMKELARSAEASLGTEQAGGLGFETVGSVTGELPASQQSQEASTLSSLIDQTRANQGQGTLLDFTTT